MSTTYEPCDVTKRAHAMGHESACGCPACTRAEFAKRHAWQQKHGTLAGYDPLTNIGEVLTSKTPETHADLVAHLEVKAAGDGMVEGYGSVFAERDSHDDIVVAGAFARSLRMRQPAMLWQHRYDAPVGVWTVAREDARGLYVKGALTLSSQAGRDAYELVTSGACTGLSIGFRTVKAQFDDAAKVRKLLDVDLFEVSFVTFPACDGARIVASTKGSAPPAMASASSLHATLDHLILSARALSDAMDRRSSALASDVAGLSRAVNHAARHVRAVRRATAAPSPADAAKAREAAYAHARAVAWQQAESW